MNVIYDEITGVYKAARVTGPAHNFPGFKMALSDEVLRLIDLEDKKWVNFWMYQNWRLQLLLD